MYNFKIYVTKYFILRKLKNDKRKGKKKSKLKSKEKKNKVRSFNKIIVI